MTADWSARDPGDELFFEPHSRLAGAKGYPITKRRWLLAGETFAGALFLSDAAATVVRLGRERFFAKRWRLVFSGTAVLVVLDAILCFVALFLLPPANDSDIGGGGGGGGEGESPCEDGDGVAGAVGAWRWRWQYWLLLHPTRGLRPLLFISHHRPMRHLVASMLRTVPRRGGHMILVVSGFRVKWFKATQACT